MFWNSIFVVILKKLYLLQKRLNENLSDMVEQKVTDEGKVEGWYFPGFCGLFLTLSSSGYMEK